MLLLASPAYSPYTLEREMVLELMADRKLRGFLWR